MSDNTKKLSGTPPELCFEDEFAFEERMARVLLTPEERAEIRAMMYPKLRTDEPKKLICFGTGNKP